jgi:hypothetical protein
MTIHILIHGFTDEFFRYIGSIGGFCKRSIEHLLSVIVSFNYFETFFIFLIFFFIRNYF